MSCYVPDIVSYSVGDIAMSCDSGDFLYCYGIGLVSVLVVSLLAVSILVVSVLECLHSD